MVLLTAEEFGYGPSVTLNCIVNNLRQMYHDRFVFMGAGVALEQAKKSMLYDEYVVCSTYDTKSLEQNESWFKKADFILSVENPNGAIFSLKYNTKVFYVDNLFWMWDYLPKKLEQVNRYFILDIFDIDAQITRLRFCTDNLIRIGPLREFSYTEREQIIPGTLLINLGGGDSFLNDKKLVNSYYSILCNILIYEAQQAAISTITICGGTSLMRSLQKECPSPGVQFTSFGQKEYLKVLHTSQHVILSPGLGNFFEILDVDPEIFMIPAINYSQFLQLEKFATMDLGIHSINWSDFEWYKEVKPYQEESIGVKAVLSNIKHFVQNGDSNHLIGRHVNRYLNRTYSSFLPQRSQKLMEFGSNGISVVISEIMKEIGANVVV